MFGKEVAAFEAVVTPVEDGVEVDADAIRRARTEWRKRGAIGKFRNIVVFIRSSSQRRQEFAASIKAIIEQTPLSKLEPREL